MAATRISDKTAGKVTDLAEASGNDAYIRVTDTTFGVGDQDRQLPVSELNPVDGFAVGSVLIVGAGGIIAQDANISWDQTLNTLNLKNDPSQLLSPQIRLRSSDGSVYQDFGKATLANNGGTHWHAITATFPSSPTSPVEGIEYRLSGAGSHALGFTGQAIKLLSGYTGSGSTICFVGSNLSAGTANDVLAGLGNSAFRASSTGVTTGANIPVHSKASGGNKNYPIIGVANTAKAGAQNVGVFGVGLNTDGAGYNVGVYAGLDSATPNLNTRAALIADNDTQTDPILVCRDNGSSVFEIQDGGVVAHTGSAIGVFTATPVGQQSITGATDSTKIDSIIALLVAFGWGTDDTT